MNRNNGDQKYDLLDIYFFKRLVKNDIFQKSVQFISLMVFIYIIYSGLKSSHVMDVTRATVFFHGTNFASVIVWDLWHPLLIFTVLLLGRLWCFACPLGAVGDWVQRVFSFGKKYPRRFANLWLATALFIFIFAMERHLFKFTRNPESTAYLLIAFFAILIAMSVIFEKRSFCRYICPIGAVLSLYAMVSSLELRCKSKKTCREHHIKECIVGNAQGKPCPMEETPSTMERSNYCIYCTECIKACSKDNIRISPRIPGQDLIKAKKEHVDEAFFIHGLIVIFLFVMGMERFAFRQNIIDFVKYTSPVKSIEFIDLYWRNILAITIFVTLTAIAAYVMYLLSKTTFSPESNARKVFVNLSYALIPFSLTVYMAGNLSKLVEGIFYITDYASDVSDGIFFGRLLLAAAGLATSVWAGYYISKNVFPDRVRSGMIPVCAMLLVYGATAFWILTLPIV